MIALGYSGACRRQPSCSLGAGEAFLYPLVLFSKLSNALMGEFRSSVQGGDDALVG